MKRILTIFIILLFIIVIGAPKAESVVIDLYDWAFYVDGTTYENFLGDSMPTSGTLDPSGLGTLTWSTSDVGSHTFIAFFDHEIDEAINTYFNEYGAANGTLAAGQSWEIDEPGYMFGDIYNNLLAGFLDNTNAIPAGLEDDVSMAMGWGFTLNPFDTATITLDLSHTAPASGFYLSHTDPDSGDYTIYYSSTLDITPIPEPGTLILFSVSLLGLLGINRKRIFNK